MVSFSCFRGTGSVAGSNLSGKVSVPVTMVTGSPTCPSKVTSAFEPRNIVAHDEHENTAIMVNIH